MKCTNCGCKDLFPVSIINSQVLATHGFVEQSVEAYACVKCGHVELFVSKEKIEREISNRQVKIDNENLKTKYNEKIIKLEAEIKNLTLILNDENQTVKTVNQAKEKLLDKQNELNAIKTKFNSIGKKQNTGSFLGG